jgi:CBS domain containing-hemolysin-like protein
VHDPVTASINLTWALIAGIVILLSNGFFVAVEFALITSRRNRLQQAADQGSGPARVVLKMLIDPDRAIAAAQLGITSSSILLGIVAEEPLTVLLTPILAPTLGALMTETAAAAIAALLVLLILSFFHMVWGEQTAKIIAIRYPEQTAYLIAYPMQLFAMLTAPFVWVVDEFTDLSLRLLGIKGTTGAHGTLASREELKDMVKQSGKVGLIEEDAQEMLNRVFDFGEMVVREVMVPRTNIVGVAREATVLELLQLFRDQRHSRFPIYEDDLDHIVGILSTKRLLALMAEKTDILDRRVDSLGLLQEPVMAPESRLISDLFTEMRATHIALVIVIDEFGGTAGLVTIEELVGEVMGQISEEWSAKPQMRKINESIFEIDAQLGVDDINEAFQLALPEDDAYETIAGLILSQLRRIPLAGEEVKLAGYKLVVLELDGPKITQVRIEKG